MRTCHTTRSFPRARNKNNFQCFVWQSNRSLIMPCMLHSYTYTHKYYHMSQGDGNFFYFFSPTTKKKHHLEAFSQHFVGKHRKDVNVTLFFARKAFSFTNAVWWWWLKLIYGLEHFCLPKFLSYIWTRYETNELSLVVFFGSTQNLKKLMSIVLIFSHDARKCSKWWSSVGTTYFNAWFFGRI